MDWRPPTKKNTWKRLLFSPLGIIVLLILVLLLMRGTWGVYKKERELQVTTNRLEKELLESEAREEFLKAEVGRLSTKEGVEVEIRKKFGVVAPGEEMVVLAGPKGEDEDLTPLEAPSFWQKLKDLFR